MASSLVCEGLHLWRGDRHVLRGVSFAVTAGEVLQITGSNGAGKTSLLRALCGLLLPEEGRICWRGDDIAARRAEYSAEMAYLGHEPPLKSDLTAAENLRYWIGVRRVVSSAVIGRALERLGAGALADRMIRTLSAGQKRRVALAGFSLLEVPVWLLDEPTTNLDTAGQGLVAELLAEHQARGGLAVAAVHHELGLPEAILRRMELGA